MHTLREVRARQMIPYKRHPELFPCGMDMGYKLNGKTRYSKKVGIRMRMFCVCVALLIYDTFT